MSQMPAHIRKQLEADKIRPIAFFGIKKQGEPPFFLAAIWPVEPDEGAGAVLDRDKFYATAEADTPEETVAIFLDKLYAGL